VEKVFLIVSLDSSYAAPMDLLETVDFCRMRVFLNFDLSMHPTFNVWSSHASFDALTCHADPGPVPSDEKSSGRQVRR